MVFTQFLHLEDHGKHIYSSTILEAWVERYSRFKGSRKGFWHKASKYTQANTADYAVHFNDFITEKKNSFKKMLEKSVQGNYLLKHSIQF